MYFIMCNSSLIIICAQWEFIVTPQNYMPQNLHMPCTQQSNPPCYVFLSLYFYVRLISATECHYRNQPRLRTNFIFSNSGPNTIAKRYFWTLGGSRLIRWISIVYLVLSMLALTRAMDLPGRSLPPGVSKSLDEDSWLLLQFTTLI